MDTSRTILRYLVLAIGSIGLSIWALSMSSSADAILLFPLSAAVGCAIAVWSAIPEQRKILQTIKLGHRPPDHRWIAGLGSMAGLWGIPMLLKPLGQQIYHGYLANVGVAVAALLLMLVADLWRRR